MDCRQQTLLLVLNAPEIAACLFRGEGLPREKDGRHSEKKWETKKKMRYTYKRETRTVNSCNLHRKLDDASDSLVLVVRRDR